MRAYLFRVMFRPSESEILTLCESFSGKDTTNLIQGHLYISCEKAKCRLYRRYLRNDHTHLQVTRWRGESLEDASDLVRRCGDGLRR
jgi:hypothetical protein